MEHSTRCRKWSLSSHHRISIQPRSSDIFLPDSGHWGTAAPFTRPPPSVLCLLVPAIDLTAGARPNLMKIEPIIVWLKVAQSNGYWLSDAVVNGQ